MLPALLQPHMSKNIHIPRMYMNNGHNIILGALSIT